MRPKHRFQPIESTPCKLSIVMNSYRIMLTFHTFRMNSKSTISRPPFFVNAKVGTEMIQILPIALLCNPGLTPG